MGFFPTESEVSVQIPDYNKFTQKDINSQSIEILDEMVKICKKNDIDIIFIHLHIKEFMHIVTLWRGMLKKMIANI